MLDRFEAFVDVFVILVFFGRQMKESEHFPLLCYTKLTLLLPVVAGAPAMQASIFMVGDIVVSFCLVVDYMPINFTFALASQVSFGCLSP